MAKRFKRTLLSTLSVAVLFLSAASVTSAEQGVELNAPSQSQSSAAVSDSQFEEQAPKFISVTGTIQEIEEYGLDGEMQLVTLETSDGSINRFVISEHTYVLDELTEGAEVVAFYDVQVPVIMIYPPQYSAVAIGLKDDNRTFKVDIFDQELVSADGSLKLLVSDDTEIINSNGDAYTGSLADRQLLVTYGASTRSIPAQTTPDQIVVFPISEEDNNGDIDEPNVDLLQPSYANVIGTIQEINEHGLDQDMQLITVETEDQNIVNLVISNQTYVDQELNIGAEVMAFYNENAPMIMIYPPQYNVEAIALVQDESSYLVDYFDADLLNYEKSLILHIGENTEIVSQDGTAYEGELAHRKLFVEYSVVLESYPAQTSPSRIVVFDEASYLENIEQKQLIVNNGPVTAPSAYLNEHDEVMVPLRAIAEALGYEVTWHGETKEVRVGIAMSLQIGKDEYVFARMAPIQLGTAPVLIDGNTYVPLSFFQEVLQADAAYVNKDAIVIH